MSPNPQRLTIMKPAQEAATGHAAEGSLVLVGVNHTTAPIEVRERLSIPATRLADAVRTLVHLPGIREGLIVSTCNRVEFVTYQDASHRSEERRVGKECRSRWSPYH